MPSNHTIGGRDLTDDQQLELKHFWYRLLTFWGNEIESSKLEDGLKKKAAEEKSKNPQQTHQKKKGFFSGWGGGSSGGDAEEETKTDTDANNASSFDPFTKYKLDQKGSEKLFWNLLYTESPDSFVLKFLRARQWNNDKGMGMFVRAMNWRLNEFRVDKLVDGGEMKFYKDENKGIIKNIEIQKAVIMSYDLEERPVILVRPRLHNSKDQDEKDLERYAILIIEQAKVYMRDPNRAVTILFDLTGFTMSNMDYTPIKFLITVFEAHYPECLAQLIIHNAPWIFNPIWNIIKKWLDPVVASKVQFSKSVNDLTSAVDIKQIPECLDGELKLDLDHFDSLDGSQDDKLKDIATRDEIKAERKQIIEEFTKATITWINTDDHNISKKLFKERIEIMKKLSENYIKLDPYIRSRSHYDINGQFKI